MSKCKRQRVVIQPTWMHGLKIEGTRIYLLVTEEECRELATGQVPSAVRAQSEEACRVLAAATGQEAGAVESGAAVPRVWTKP